ncbi:MAG: S8 family serine peptidase [Dehalococcoidia bacterium]|nr:S8 family serine peptidase [Dehalococcoidia bacterium]
MGKGRTGISRRQILTFACWILAMAAALTFIFLLLSPPAEASAPGPETPGAFRPGALLVKFKPPVFPALAGGVLSLQGYRTLSTYDDIGIRLIAVTPGQEIESLPGLRSNPLVEFAEPDYVRDLLWAPNDPDYGPYQWNLRKINLEAAWDISRGVPGVKVAVIDTGLDMPHSDRPANIVSPFNECTSNSSVSDDNGHGTHVSGIIAANTNNGIGVAGIAPGVSLMPIRVECPDPNGNNYIYVSTEVNALHYAADNGARVISISLGGTFTSTSELVAINYALGKGALVIAAAGNCYADGSECDGQINPVSYPAGYPGVLAVAATTASDTHASYSEEGTFVSIAAPGGDGTITSTMILSTYPNSSYAYMDGTSMATPHVSGLAGLIFSVNPALSSLDVTNIITSTAVDLGAPGKDDIFGWGRIDALAALTKAQQTAPSGSPTATPTPVGTFTPTPTSTSSPTPSPVGTTMPTPTPTPLPSPTPTPIGGGTNQGATPLTKQAYLPLVERENSGW